MGVRQSVGYLHIHLDSRSIQAGGAVHGTIHLKLTECVQVSVLLLLFDGEEYTQFTQDSARRMMTYHLINQRFPIYLFNEGYLNAGDYSFPFVFTVPSTLPGSFHLEEWEDETLAYIQYTITARVEGCNVSIESSKVGVHLNQLMSDPIYSVTDAVNSFLRPCCGRERGTVGVKVFFNKDAFVPGETMQLTIDINNSHSQLDVLGYRVTLYRTIRLKAEFGTRIRKKEIINWNIPLRVPRGEALLGEQSKHQDLVFPSGKNSIGHTTSVHSCYIDCAYSVKVKLAMKTGSLCCVGVPEVKQHVVIYPPQLPQYLPPMIPTDWTPSVMSLATFAVGEEYNYAPVYAS